MEAVFALTAVLQEHRIETFSLGNDCAAIGPLQRDNALNHERLRGMLRAWLDR